MVICLLNGITYDDLMVFADSGVAIDEINFPDENFRNYVKKFDANKDGTLSENDIKNIVYIDCPNMNILNLKGIEYFNNLMQLNCYNNQLINLDLSKNSNLKNIYCENNQLTSLDVSKNINLIFLACFDNKLISLDVSRDSNLETLYCYSN